MIILSQPKQLEILKTILVNRFLMVFQNQPMLGNGLAMPCSGFSLEQCVRFGMHKAIAVFMD
jgi:hypothetical protein